MEHAADRPAKEETRHSPPFLIELVLILLAGALARSVYNGTLWLPYLHVSRAEQPLVFWLGCSAVLALFAGILVAVSDRSWLACLSGRNASKH